jgi:glycosyltransferase involved in cell wall biosynthesis
MALGLPVVSSNCPYGPAEIIEDGKSGILVPPADPEALANSILRVLQDEALRGQLALEAKERIEAFSIERKVKEFEALFSAVAQRGDSLKAGKS